jgi:hypothetical protein
MKNSQIKMTKISLWAAAISAGALLMVVRPASAQEGVLYKLRAGDTNYCHMKFPAIRPDTLAWDRPVLQNPSRGTIIDFYGPCDYDPTGKAAVETQKRDRQRMWNREYAS